MINKESFKIKFNGTGFNKSDVVINKYEEIHWFWRLLGFRIGYGVIVLSDPVANEEGYVYNVKMNSKIYYWLKFKLKEVIL
jgi:hypothetical protein